MCIALNEFKENLNKYMDMALIWDIRIKKRGWYKELGSDNIST